MSDVSSSPYPIETAYRFARWRLIMGGSAISAVLALLAANQAPEGSIFRQFSVGVAVVSTFRFIDGFTVGAPVQSTVDVPLYQEKGR